MDKKELLEKFFKYVVITIILGIVICSITYLYNAKKVDVGFVKDVYSILFSIIAPLFAIFLFADWKEQKNFDTDLELLKACDENLCRFQIELDFICDKIIKIYNTYENDKDFYIAHSLYRKPLEIENKYLEDFYIHVTRYLDFNKSEDLSKLTNEYYGLANDFLYINKDFAEQIYKHIYKELKKQNDIEYVDAILTISFSPTQDANKRFLNQKYSILKRNFINTGYIEEDIYNTEAEGSFKNYCEYYEYMKKIYNEMNTMIKNKIRA